MMFWLFAILLFGGISSANAFVSEPKTLCYRGTSSKTIYHTACRSNTFACSPRRQRRRQRLGQDMMASQRPAVLFSSKSTVRAQLMSMIYPHNNRRIRKLCCTRTWIRIMASFVGALSVVFFRFSIAAAAVTLNDAAVVATSAETRGLHRLLFLGRYFRRKRKAFLYSALGLLGAASLVDVIATKRRQSKDATSEWSRYARHPSARGRAIASMMLFKMLPLLLYIRITCRHRAKGSKRWNRLQTHAGNVFSDSMLKLGPLYIKLGQILSCREKLLPEQWKTAMERLQDQVPSKSGKDAEELAYNAWPGGKAKFDETFSEMDWTPLAAASLGQVHKARLAGIGNDNNNDGDAVALKLQRPYLREIYDKDFALLTKVASIVDKYFGSSAGSVGGVSQSWTEIFEDAEEILYREIDYRDEAENGIRFCRDFGLAKGGQAAKNCTAKSFDGKPLPSAAPWLRAPYVYDDLSTEKVLVMENVPSIKITASDKLDEANVTAEDREYLADCLGRSYLRQFCCNRFFSTDPHAGNLGVEILNLNSTDPAERVRLVFYDFGQAAELQENQAGGILDIIEAIVDMDVDRSVKSFQRMNVLKEGADLDAVREKVADNYRTGKVKANRKRLKKRGYKFKEGNPKIPVASNSTGTNTTKVRRTGDEKVMQYFTLPAEYAFVGRALSQMDGVGKSLDPDFDFISSAAPWIYEIKGAGKYLREEVQKWFTGLRDQICDLLSPDRPKR